MKRQLFLVEQGYAYRIVEAETLDDVLCGRQGGEQQQGEAGG
jgi:hypothetical protein